ncbi:hypothetical protein [Streptomyces sp. AC512_CC834]|uniref:hypothetical protein n=1 Tax=Streptomyces sp. AC512_CC834 TaxID=2823691 RepID=UPI001C264657|nr:hypothetical protein [Streptomyces sp. AC512_CC834]
MKKYRKLMLAGVIAVATAGGTGAAMAATDGAEKAKVTDSYRTPHKNGDGSEERGKTSITKDDGKPSFQKDGPPPTNGEKPEFHSYRAR